MAALAGRSRFATHLASVPAACTIWHFFAGTVTRLASWGRAIEAGVCLRWHFMMLKAIAPVKSWPVCAI